MSANDYTEWGFYLTAVGFCATLLGLFFTYRQAANARHSAEKTKEELQRFGSRKDKAEAANHVGRAILGIEVAAVLIDAGKWKDASSAYDEARRALQSVRAMPIELPLTSAKQLRLVCDHLRAFSDSVDNAADGKGDFPDRGAVRSSIRRNSDDLSRVQRELQEDPANGL